MKVTHVDVASGATNPKAIYIRSYIGDDSTFRGHQAHSKGERPIRRSLAPRELSVALKQELEKMAPAKVLEDDEVPTTGWLVESDIQYVTGGSRMRRSLPGGHLGAGQSRAVIHVRVTDLDGGHVHSEAKKDVSGPVATTVAGSGGPVIYEFDVEGGSRLTGRLGSIYAPGLGEATRFDFKNAAERVMMALSVDPHRYGVRTSPVIR